MTTFAALDIGEQFFACVGWNGCPQLGCGVSKFGNGFGGHANYKENIAQSGCQFWAW
uniref:Uncharacterized protein n=1 Tax=Candidatus Nitrotoga fabula TaxID=2182327 RepID=A0A2X0QUT8_9PROT|nr:protein of unknown function [Candidatus Nitrotoga fabula]